MSYEVPKQFGGCGEVWVLTRAVLGILFWPLVAIIATVTWIFVMLYAFLSSPPLALIPLVLGIIAIMLFVRWDRNRSLPPE